jgi:hypothetical protein
MCSETFWNSHIKQCVWKFCVCNFGIQLSTFLPVLYVYVQMYSVITVPVTSDSMKVLTFLNRVICFLSRL